MPFEDAIELSCNCEITPSHEPRKKDRLHDDARVAGNTLHED
jgi:hypothetical protein